MTGLADCLKRPTFLMLMILVSIPWPSFWPPLRDRAPSYQTDGPLIHELETLKCPMSQTRHLIN
jgi:hypothetical protein